MSDTIKLIIEIPKKTVAHIRSDYGHGYKGIYDDDRDIIVDAIYNAPSADIMERAREIQDYCEGFPNCEGCRFYKNLPFGCTFGICPQEWNLPTPWADDSIFEKGGNDDNT